MCNEYDEFREGSSYLSAGALEQVLREAVRIREEDVVRKPVTHVLTVSKQDAQRIIPKTQRGWVNEVYLTVQDLVTTTRENKTLTNH